MSVVAYKRKTPTEKIFFESLWTQDLAVGETILSQTWAGSPSGLTFASQSIDNDSGTSVARIEGGTVNLNYTVTNQITTSNGQVLEKVWILRVRAQHAALSGYITLDRVQRELNVVDEAVLDLLEDIIIEAKDITDAYCQRSFAKQTGVSEKVRGYDDAFILVSVTPILEITSIAVDGVLLDEDDYEIDDAAVGTIYREAGWQSKNLFAPAIMNRPVPNSQQADITVVYDGGYILPGVTGRTLPYDIERANFQMIKHIYQTRWRDTSIVSEKADDIYTVTYGDGASADIPTIATNLLDRWRRKHVI